MHNKPRVGGGFFSNLIGMMKDKETPFRDKALIIGGIVYIISPIDLIPEGILLFLGYGDDLAVLLGTIGLIRKNYKRYMERQRSSVIDVTNYEWEK